MRTTRLDAAAYERALNGPMTDVTQTATDVINIWPYVRSVPKQDLQGHRIWKRFFEKRFVEFVSRTGDAAYDHVMVMTRTKNVYLVIVIDLLGDRILGHRLLDLNEAYGLPPPPTH